MDDNRILRDQFTFYRSFWEAMKALPMKDRLPFVMAVGSYVFEETVEEPVGAALASFLLVRPVLDKANKRAANGKRGGSKPKANSRQNGSKTEANGKQTANEIEGEGEVEVESESENDSSLPPAPLSGGTPSPDKPAPQAKPKPGKPQEENWGFGPELTDAFRAWIRYKDEKRQGYKPEGLRALVTETRHNAERYGEAQVAALIRKCMSANWQGIIWERLERMPKEGRNRQAECGGDVSWMKGLIEKRKGQEGGT